MINQPTDAKNNEDLRILQLELSAAQETHNALNALNEDQLQLVVNALAKMAIWAFEIGKGSNTIVLSDINQQGWYD